MTLAAREDLRKHVPVLAVNNCLWSTLNSPRVLEQQHDGRIQPLMRSVGSRKPFPPALMGAGPSPTALMTSPEFTANVAIREMIASQLEITYRCIGGKIPSIYSLVRQN